MSKYFPVHVHTTYSLSDGLSQPSRLAKRVAALELPGCAVTDHGTVSGAVAFMSAMEKKGLKPIIGCELYVCEQSPQIKTDENRSLSHMLVLAKNEQGWKQLIRLTSSANTPEHFYYKPRLDLDSIAPYADGNMICVTGHLGSNLSKCIFADIASINQCVNEDEAKQYTHTDWVARCTALLNKLCDIFGKDNVFVEIQLIDSRTMPAVRLLAKGLRYIAKKLGLKCVATPDAHYPEPEDAFDQRVLLCKTLGTTIHEVHKKMVSGEQVGLAGFFRSKNYYVPSYEDLVACGNTEEELANTLRVADMCEVYKIGGKPRLPKFTCPDGMDSPAYLRRLCRDGWMKLRDKLEKTGHSKTEYGERFEKEFKVLNDFGLSDYFLIVHDIINYARGDGQLTGAGRGSAAGSLVLYLLGVTALDPLEYDLLFERFMNAGRGAGTMPDVDMDFERGSRPKIIQYIKNKYGSDKVAHMVTFGRLQGRGSLKEVMRVHNACSFEEMNKITEHIPGESEISDQLQAMKEADKAAGGDGEASIIEWALEHNAAELKPWAYYNDADVIEGSFANIFAQAIRLEGTKITQGKHPSGVIISNDPLAEICPMVYDKTDDEMIVGFDFNDAEHIGLVKFDILAVNLLDKIHGVFNLLRNGKLK